MKVYKIQIFFIKKWNKTARIFSSPLLTHPSNTNLPYKTKNYKSMEQLFIFLSHAKHKPLPKMTCPLCSATLYTHKHIQTSLLYLSDKHTHRTPSSSLSRKVCFYHTHTSNQLIFTYFAQHTKSRWKVSPHHQLLIFNHQILLSL